MLVCLQTTNNSLKQNYHYLLEYYAFKAQRSLTRVRKHRSEKELDTIGQDVIKGAKKVADFRKVLESKNIKVNNNEPLNHALVAYTRWQQLNVRANDPFTALVIMIPCIYVSKQAHDEATRI